MVITYARLSGIEFDENLAFSDITFSSRRVWELVGPNSEVAYVMELEMTSSMMQGGSTQVHHLRGGAEPSWLMVPTHLGCTYKVLAEVPGELHG